MPHDAAHCPNPTGCPFCNPELAAFVKLSPKQQTMWLTKRNADLAAGHMRDHSTQADRRAKLGRRLQGGGDPVRGPRTPDKKYAAVDGWQLALEKRRDYTPPPKPTGSPIARNDFKSPDPFAAGIARMQKEMKEKNR